MSQDTISNTIYYNVIKRMTFESRYALCKQNNTVWYEILLPCDRTKISSQMRFTQEGEVE